MLKQVAVKPNSYERITCTCGRLILVWLGETVYHIPKTANCSEYLGVIDKKPFQPGFDLME